MQPNDQRCQPVGCSGFPEPGLARPGSLRRALGGSATRWTLISGGLGKGVRSLRRALEGSATRWTLISGGLAKGVRSHSEWHPRGSKLVHHRNMSAVEVAEGIGPLDELRRELEEFSRSAQVFSEDDHPTDRQIPGTVGGCNQRRCGDCCRYVRGRDGTSRRPGATTRSGDGAFRFLQSADDDPVGMILGRYGDTTGRPYIQARVKVLERYVDVSFLVDTGADARPVGARGRRHRHRVTAVKLSVDRFARRSASQTIRTMNQLP